MKKIISIMLAGFMAASLFAGCGKTNLKSSDLHILDDSLADELYGIATEKNNTALRDMIQVGLNECIADGTAAEIATEWFGSDTIYIPEAQSFQPDLNATFI